MWHIVDQSQDEGLTQCKLVRFFKSVDKKTGDTKVGRLSAPVYKIIIRHEKENKDHVLIYSVKTRLFTHTYPNGEKEEAPTLDAFIKTLQRFGPIAESVYKAFIFAGVR